MKNLLKWFIRTFKGYSVMYFLHNDTITFTHRPFRAPIFKIEPNILRGKSFSYYVIDDLEVK